MVTHMHMGCPYVYGTAHTRMVPIRVWTIPYMHVWDGPYAYMGKNTHMVWNSAMNIASVKLLYYFANVNHLAIYVYTYAVADECK